MSSGPAFSSPATIFTGRNPIGSGWYSASGDDGVYILDDAWLAVFGANATVTFGSGTDIVSFNGPSTGNYIETVIGSGGSVIAVHADVTLTGDNDIVYFDPSDDVLNLTAATAGAWSTLYAHSGVVNLAGASLSILGGGVTVNGVSGANAVSLYQTNGVADAITGDDMTVALVNSEAVVHGDRNAIWLVGGSGSTVTVDSAVGAFDTVYGAGIIEVASGAVASVGGGALINFLSPGGFAAVSYTQGIWDRIEGAAGTTSAYAAQLAVFGANQIVRFTGGDDDAASLYQTNGNWDSVYGSASTILVNSAQVNIFGAVDNIYLAGTGSEVSLYNGYYASFLSNNIFGSNATIDVNGLYGVHVNGGNDTIYTDPGQYNNISLLATAGAWDTIYAQNQILEFDSAQVSVVGGGNSIFLSGSSDAISLYGTDGGSTQIYNGNAAVTLTNAAATLSGDKNYVYFGVGTNSLDLGISNVFAISSDDLLTFKGSFGVDTVTGFNSTDTIALSAAQFADFSAFQRAFQQQGNDAVLTLDANDKVTFVGLQTSSVTAAQVKFV